MRDLAGTIRLPRPQPARLTGAVALWLPALPTIAGVYALLVARIRDHGYGAREYLDRSRFDEFKDNIPWPPRS